MTAFVETQRKRRGHNFLPPKSVKVPALYTNDDVPAEDQVVVLHYFAATGDWWLTEMGVSETNGRLTGFGYVRLSAFPEGAEWGYVDLGELEAVNAHHGLVIVERDCHWTPVTMWELASSARWPGHYAGI